MQYDSVVGTKSRKFARRFVWAILACCFIVDGTLGEAAISGSGDVGQLDANGTFSFPGPEPELWRWIAGFVFFQGILVLALIRLREPKHPQKLFTV